MSNIPDYFTPLVGWRVWSGYDPISLGLKALTNNYYWVPDAPLTCKCECCGGPTKPSMTNMQGFYAFKSLRDLIRQRAHVYHRGYHQSASHHMPIVGQVYLWGTIVDCEFGYRAEKAYPKSLLVCSEEVKEHLQSKWRVEIEVGDIEQLFRNAIKQIGGKSE